MRLFNFNSRHDSAVAVVPLTSIETGHLPHPRQRTVGGHQQISLQGSAAFQVNCVATACCIAQDSSRAGLNKVISAAALTCPSQGTDDCPVFHDMSQQPAR